MALTTRPSADLLNDYIVILDGELSPEPEDIVDREFEEAARMVGLPAYVVRRAQEEGAVSESTDLWRP